MRSIPVGARPEQIVSSRCALQVSAMDGVPFCDYLNVSVPLEFEASVMDGIRPVLDMVGACEVSPGMYRFVNHPGTFKRGRRGPVAVFGASGDLLERLRQACGKFGGDVLTVGLMGEYLSALGSVPHRVTSIDVSADFIVSGPDLMRAVRRDAFAGKIYLTRKRVDPQNVDEWFSKNVEGRLTGTVRMGKRANSDVWAKVYDKQHERVSRGFADPGPRGRVEITAKSDVGATLHDAESPSGLFYHFACPSLVERPVGVDDWRPHGEGYVLPVKREWTVIERVQRLLDTSPDIGRLCELAREGFGSNPVPRLLRMLASQFVARANASLVEVAA